MCANRVNTGRPRDDVGGMRPRSIRTTTLLAVALGAAGCAERPAPTPVTAEPAPSPSGSAAAASRAAPRCDDSAAVRSLAEILSNTERSEALRQVARYRPICDGEGFPLVGNFYRKGPTSTQPSEFCADVRKLEGRR